MVRFLTLSLVSVPILCLSCRSMGAPSQQAAGKTAAVRVAEPKKAPRVVPDYTADWRRIADLAGKTEYDPYITDIVWHRLNWRDYLSGKVFSEFAADLEREYKWEKRLRDWEAKRQPAEPAGESKKDSES